MAVEIYDGLLSEMQGLLGRRVQVEIGSRDPAGQPNYRPGDEEVYATFLGVLKRGQSEDGAVVFEVGASKLRLPSAMSLSGYWRDRNHGHCFEIMSLQPVVIWVTPLSDEETDTPR
jgi:hypothetical protein